jgi:hypothetical protein
LVQRLIQILAELLTAYRAFRFFGDTLMTPWRRIGGGEIEPVDIHRQAFTPSLVALIEPDVGHNFHQPSAAALLLGQLMQRSIGSQKGLLDQILGGARVSGQAHGGVMERIQMGQDQSCKSVFARSWLSPVQHRPTRSRGRWVAELPRVR